MLVLFCKIRPPSTFVLDRGTELQQRPSRSTSHGEGGLTGSTRLHEGSRDGEPGTVHDTFTCTIDLARRATLREGPGWHYAGPRRERGSQSGQWPAPADGVTSTASAAPRPAPTQRPPAHLLGGAEGPGASPSRGAASPQPRKRPGHRPTASRRRQPVRHRPPATSRRQGARRRRQVRERRRPSPQALPGSRMRSADADGSGRAAARGPSAQRGPPLAGVRTIA